MKAIIATLMPTISVLLAINLVSSARGDDGDQSFHFKNSLDETAGLWIASEKSTKADPWAHVVVAAGEDGTVTLRAPDRFVVVVDIGNQRSRSKPIALKAFLAKHPDYSLSVNFLVSAAGVGVGGPSSPAQHQFEFSAPPATAKQSGDSNSAAAAEKPDTLDFGFETKPIESDSGNQ
jgi:hypothetical protein